MPNAQQESEVSTSTGGQKRIKFTGTRLFELYLALLVLLAVIAGVVFYILRMDTDVIIKRLISDQTNTVSHALENHLTELQDTLLQHVAVLSHSPTLLDAVARGDKESLQRIVNKIVQPVDFFCIADIDDIQLTNWGSFEPSPGAIPNSREMGKPQVGIYKDANNRLFIMSTAAVFDGKRQVGGIVAIIDLAKREILESFKSSHGMEATIFAGPVRINSTVARMRDENIIGTKANKKIIDAVLDNKKRYFGRVFVNERSYQGLYSPVISNEKAIGMLYVGVDIHDILMRQASIRNQIFLLVGIVICVFGGSVIAVGRYERLHSGTVNELSRATSSLEMLENVLNSLDIYLYVTDPENRKLLFVNKRLREHFPLDDSALGKACWQVFFADKEKHCDNCALPLLLKNPQKEVRSEDYNPLTGRYYKHIDRLIDWPDGKKVFFCQRIDITSIKQAQEKAEEASRAQSNFLSRMSHEMRTPLNAILGMAHIAANQGNRKAVLDSLKKIEASAGHLLTLVNDVLDIKALESGKLSLNKSAFRIRELLDQVQGLLSLKMKENEHSFTSSVASDVPESIVADKNRLVQVINHLLHNACKFTPRGGNIALRISRIDEPLDKAGECSLTFEVEDDGVSVAEDKKKQIFELFEQADNSITRKHGGSGLGLAISQHIIRAMNGMIWFKAAKEQGAIFAFTIRVGIGDDAAMPPSSVEAPPAPKQIFAGRKLLLVDDVHINREIVIALLEDTGITIDCAVNGREACEKFAADPESYDLIILDIHMPEMNGYEAGAAIRSMDLPNSQTIPIVAMTADIFTQDLEKYQAGGMNEHLGKPVQVDVLMDMLKRFLLNL